MRYWDPHDNGMGRKHRMYLSARSARASCKLERSSRSATNSSRASFLSRTRRSFSARSRAFWTVSASNASCNRCIWVSIVSSFEEGVTRECSTIILQVMKHVLCNGVDAHMTRLWSHECTVRPFQLRCLAYIRYPYPYPYLTHHTSSFLCPWKLRTTR